MDDMTLQVAGRSSSSEGLVVAGGGDLDEDGALALARKTHAAQEKELRSIRIDVGEVCLFNCSGARQLITLLNDLERLGYDVDLVGVRPPLQKILDLST